MARIGEGRPATKRANPSPIAKALKQIRLEKNISLETLGKTIGRGARSISYWERGLESPRTIHLLETWANALGYDLELMKR